MGMPTEPRLLPLPERVPEQEHLTSFVPTVVGPIEYREWKQQLERIHEVLGLGGVEQMFQRLALQKGRSDRSGV